METFWAIAVVFALVLGLGFLAMSLRRPTHARHHPGAGPDDSTVTDGPAYRASRERDDRGDADGGDSGGGDGGGD